MFIGDIKNTVIAAVVAFCVGASVGFYTKSQFVKADQLESVTEARHESAQNVQQSLATSLVVEQKVTDSTQQVVAIRKTVAARIQPKIQETSHEANLRPACPDGSLDVGTVRLLNSARDGSALDPAVLGDGASQAPSGVGLPELLDNDLEVVQLYRELAVRHDALVDYVDSLTQQQAAE